MRVSVSPGTNEKATILLLRVDHQAIERRLRRTVGGPAGEYARGAGGGDEGDHAAIRLAHRGQDGSQDGRGSHHVDGEGVEKFLGVQRPRPVDRAENARGEDDVGGRPELLDRRGDALRDRIGVADVGDDRVDGLGVEHGEPTQLVGRAADGDDRQPAGEGEFGDGAPDAP